MTKSGENLKGPDYNHNYRRQASINLLRPFDDVRQTPDANKINLQNFRERKSAELLSINVLGLRAQ